MWSAVPIHGSLSFVLVDWLIFWSQMGSFSQYLWSSTSLNEFCVHLRDQLWNFQIRNCSTIALSAESTVLSATLLSPWRVPHKVTASWRISWSAPPSQRIYIPKQFVALWKKNAQNTLELRQNRATLMPWQQSCEESHVCTIMKHSRKQLSSSMLWSHLPLMILWRFRFMKEKDEKLSWMSSTAQT